MAGFDEEARRVEGVWGALEEDGDDKVVVEGLEGEEKKGVDSLSLVWGAEEDEEEVGPRMAVGVEVGAGLGGADVVRIEGEL